MRQQSQVPIRFTKEGYEKIKKEQQDLLEKRKEAVLLLKTAREMGDLSENAAYHVAKSRLSFTDRRLRQLKNLLRFGKIIERNLSGFVDVGSRVILEKDGKQTFFELVGDFEADPLNRKISVKSPLGKLIYRKSIGEVVDLYAPVGKLTYKIVAIE